MIFTKAIATFLLITITTSVQQGWATEAKKSTFDDQTTTRAEGIVLGALLGGILGAITGDNKKDKMKKAGLGVVVGAMAGFLLGNEVAKRKQMYASREQAIVQETSSLAKLSKETQTRNQQLRQEIQAYDQKIAELQKKLTEENQRALELDQQRQALQKRQNEVEQELASVTKELAISEQLYKEYQQGAANTAGLQQWQTNLSQLQQEKKGLEEQLTAMNSRIR
jgi:uncharacterized protein YcfJ